MAGMHRLEDLRQRRPISIDCLALGGLLRHRRVVTQRLPQTAHAARTLRRSQQHLDHRARREILAQVVVDFRSGRLDILQHFLEQRIVAIGQHLDQLVQRILLVVLHLGRNLNQLRRLSLAVAISPLAHHIDIAAHGLAMHDRHLPQHQRRAGKPLQGGERVAHAAFQRIDLVDEQHVRNAFIRKPLQQWCDGQRTCRRRLAHNHGEIDHSQRATRFVGEFHGTRAIQHRPGVAEIGAVSESDLGGCRTIARISRPLYRRPRSLHQRLEQCRLAAAVWPDQRHRAGTSAVLCS